MAHEAKTGAHWRNLGKSRDFKMRDKSKDAFLGRLGIEDGGTLATGNAAGARDVVEAHAGVASVNTDGGTKPRAHDCDDCGPNAAANEKFNQQAQGPREGGYLGNKTGR
jgi:hypothetical protein